MKRFLVLPAALMLANCAAVPAVVSAASEAVVVGQQVEVPATQALLVAHNAYQGAAYAATAAVQAGLVKGDNLDRLSDLNFQAKTALDLADHGHDIAHNAATVMNLVAKMHSLIGG